MSGPPSELGLGVVGDPGPEGSRVLTADALALVVELERELGGRRRELLLARDQRQLRIAGGELPDFLAGTRAVREDLAWRVAPPPSDLLDRRVEITGPVERKMMINALNSGASAFMADFEDAHSPTWLNCIEGQANLIDAVERTISLERVGRSYRLDEELATLMVRPRGWHLEEKHLLVDGRPVSASLFDFGLFAFHCSRRLLERGSGPYLYLPKLESHLEARLWNDACRLAEDRLSLGRGAIRATVLVETVLAAFEMEEILFELRERSVGLNAGRWDYMFSIIKKFRDDPHFVLPDRGQVAMTVPFMRAYTELLVKTCHSRGAHAIGGMAAFIPSRRDQELNRIALEKVREDKLRESSDGFDGTWVAHPDLVPVARQVFDDALGGRLNQVERLREEVQVGARELLDVPSTPGEITGAGIRLNVSVGIQYLASWLRGVGAAAINNLMEDAATAEISRSQIWQWLRHQRVERERVLAIRDEVVSELGPGFAQAAELFSQVALAEEFVPFMTVPAYQLLD